MLLLPSHSLPGFDPDDGVLDVESGICHRTSPEAGAYGVAPVTPLLLTGGLLARCINVAFCV